NVAAYPNPPPVAARHRPLLEQLTALPGSDPRQQLGDRRRDLQGPATPAPPPIAVQERSGQLQPPGGCAAPATSREEDAGDDPQHVQRQVPEEGLVRVVDVEHHAVLPRGAVRPVRAEVLEMEVSAEKTFVLGPARQARRAPEHPVEER